MRKRIAECEMRIAELEMGNAKLGRFRIPDSTIFGASQSFPLRNPQSAFLSPQFRNPQSAIRNPKYFETLDCACARAQWR
jgi:hypothetical protein